MPLSSNPLTDAINAAWQKELESVLPKVERAYAHYERIDTETASVIAQIREKLDQLVIIAPAKAEEIAQFRLELDELAKAVALWTMQAKYQLSTLIN